MMGTNTVGVFISIMQSSYAQFNFGTNKQQSAWAWAPCVPTLLAWDHYVGTYAGVMNLYKNGVWQSTANYTLTGATAVNIPLYIGKGISGSFFKGKIDDVLIYKRVLTQQEITTLFNSTITDVQNTKNENEFVLFPNPVQTNFTIKLNKSNLNNATSPIVEIIDITGKKSDLPYLLDNYNIVVDASNLSSGIYFANLTIGGTKKVIKLLKQ